MKIIYTYDNGDSSSWPVSPENRCCSEAQVSLGSKGASAGEGIHCKCTESVCGIHKTYSGYPHHTKVKCIIFAC